jgi:hypothetical protein
MSCKLCHERHFVGNFTGLEVRRLDQESVVARVESSFSVESVIRLIKKTS